MRLSPRRHLAAALPKGKQVRQRTGRKNNTASRNNFLHRLFGGITALALASSQTSLLAQESAAPDQLADLIPDSAVENPEDWASQGVDRQQPVEGAGEPALESDSSLPDMPALVVPWPDDLDIPKPEPLEAEKDVRFAETDQNPLDVPPDAIVVAVSDELALGFPADEARFPVRDEFIDRFEALSTIEELGDDQDNIAQLAARARADEDLLGQMLRTYGYYDAQVTRTVGGIRPGEGEASEEPKVRFDIVPGVRYRFGTIDLGNLGQAPDYQSLRAAFGIQAGDPVSSDAIVREQSDLDHALGETGYPFATIAEPELLIDHERTEGDLVMPVSPNGKYVFAGVESNLPDFLSGKHLGTIARFDTGDVYKRSLELDLRRAVIATGLVSSAVVTPRAVKPPQGELPGEVVLDVEMSKAKLRTIAGAIGYGSEEGFRVQASWEHRNFFPPEGAIRLRGIAGTQEQLAGITFRRNNFGGRDRILSIDAYASTVDSPAFNARTVAFHATYERTSTLLFQKPLSWSVGLEAVATGERPPAVNGVVQPRQTFFVGAIPLYVLIDTSDNLLDPTEGFRLGGRLSPEVSRSNGAESFYLRSQVDASYYQRINDRVVMAGRTRLGTIPGTALDNIAPSRRLYAGGGGSVRGYGFREIGPRDVAGEPSGGRSLVEFSLEARIRTGFFDGALSVVPFVDAGSISSRTTPDFDEIKFGAGVGIRYHTGFGPIRVDVGVPLNPGPGDNPVAVYVSLGQAF